MTTPPIMSVTDELIAELEAACAEEPIVELGRTTILALLSERAELKRDAERYRWLRDNDQFYGPSQKDSVAYAAQHYTGSQFDAEIDSAMTP